MARNPKAPLRDRDAFMTGEMARWIGTNSHRIARWIDAGRIRASVTRGIKGQRVRWIPRAEAVRLLKKANRRVAGVWPRIPDVAILARGAPPLVIARAFRKHGVRIRVRAVQNSSSALKLFSLRPAPVLLLVLATALQSRRERTGAMRAIEAASDSGAPAAILARDGAQARTFPTILRACGASVIVVRTIEELKDRIWPLVFGNDPRGTRAKRRAMNYEVPM